MNEDDKRRYDALMDKIGTILHQIEDMRYPRLGASLVP